MPELKPVDALLFWGIFRNDRALIKVALQEGADPNCLYSPQFVVDTIEFILEQENKDTGAIARLAHDLIYQHVNVFSLFVAKTINPNIQITSQTKTLPEITPLMLAITLEREIDIINDLLINKANPNQEIFGCQFFYIFIATFFTGRAELIAALINHDADLASFKEAKVDMAIFNLINKLAELPRGTAYEKFLKVFNPIPANSITAELIFALMTNQTEQVQAILDQENGMSALVALMQDRFFGFHFSNFIKQYVLDAETGKVHWDNLTKLFAELIKTPNTSSIINADAIATMLIESSQKEEINIEELESVLNPNSPFGTILRTSSQNPLTDFFKNTFGKSPLEEIKEEVQRRKATLTANEGKNAVELKPFKSST